MGELHSCISAPVPFSPQRRHDERQSNRHDARASRVCHFATYQGVGTISEYYVVYYKLSVIVRSSRTEHPNSARHLIAASAPNEVRYLYHLHYTTTISSSSSSSFIEHCDRSRCQGKYVNPCVFGTNVATLASRALSDCHIGRTCTQFNCMWHFSV